LRQCWLRACLTPEPQRRFAARLVTVAYAGLALLALVAAIALEDFCFIVTGLIFLIAIAATMISYRR
jgi:hypothetical protein